MNVPSQTSYSGSEISGHGMNNMIPEGKAQLAHASVGYTADGGRPTTQQYSNYQQHPNVPHNPSSQQPPRFQQNPNLPPTPYPQTSPPLPLQQNPNLRQGSQPQQVSSRPQALWRQFKVATNREPISSGFPYHPQLSELKVAHNEWNDFTSEVVTAAKLSVADDKAAWSAGVGVGAASSAFLLVFGPPIGYYAGKSIHKKTVVRKVKERMLEDGDMRAVLNKWNQRTFKWKGFQVWLECPFENGGAPTPTEHWDRKKFKIVIIPYTEKEESFESAPWSQMQPGLVEAPSASPQRPVELQSTPATGIYPPQLEQVSPNSHAPVLAGFDGKDNSHVVSQPMIAELDGSH